MVSSQPMEVTFLFFTETKHISVWMASTQITQVVFSYVSSALTAGDTFFVVCAFDDRSQLSSAVHYPSLVQQRVRFILLTSNK